jgi:hypothetical protein
MIWRFHKSTQGTSPSCGSLTSSVGLLMSSTRMNADPEISPVRIGTVNDVAGDRIGRSAAFHRLQRVGVSSTCHSPERKRLKFGWYLIGAEIPLCLLRSSSSSYDCLSSYQDVAKGHLALIKFTPSNDSLTQAQVVLLISMRCCRSIADNVAYRLELHLHYTIQELV